MRQLQQRYSTEVLETDIWRKTLKKGGFQHFICPRTENVPDKICSRFSLEKFKCWKKCRKINLALLFRASKIGVHRKIKIKKCPVNPRFTRLPKG